MRKREPEISVFCYADVEDFIKNTPQAQECQDAIWFLWQQVYEPPRWNDRGRKFDVIQEIMAIHGNAMACRVMQAWDLLGHDILQYFAYKKKHRTIPGSSRDIDDISSEDKKHITLMIPGPPLMIMNIPCSRFRWIFPIRSVFLRDIH